MPVIYYKAPDVEKLANGTVIPKWHQHLVMVPILYRAASELPMKNGKRVLAKTKKTTPMEEHLCGARLMVIVDESAWKYGLTNGQRIALLDRELSHVIEDKKNGGFKMQGHDIEEFIAVVQRHGAWKEDLQQFLWHTKNAQLELFRGVEDGKVHIQETLEEIAEQMRETVNRGGATVTLSSGGQSVTIEPDDDGAPPPLDTRDDEELQVDKETGELLE